jgi:hypothetical protein
MRELDPIIGPAMPRIALTHGQDVAGVAAALQQVQAAYELPAIKVAIFDRGLSETNSHWLIVDADGTAHLAARRQAAVPVEYVDAALEETLGYVAWHLWYRDIDD